MKSIVNDCRAIFRSSFVPLIVILGMMSFAATPESSFANSPSSKCISLGKIEKVKSEYFECVRVGSQLKLKKVSLSKWKESLYASTKLVKLPETIVDPIESAAGWSSIPFLRQMKWSSDEGHYPISDGVPIQNGTGARVLLMGDSLAGAIGPSFLQIQKTYNWDLRVVFRSSCQIAETNISYKTKEELEKCEIARMDRIKVITDFKPEILVLMEDPLNPVVPNNGETASQTWQKGLARALVKLEKFQNMKIVMISRPVGVSKSLQDCLKRNDQLGKDCFGIFSKDLGIRLVQKKEVEKIGGKFLDLTPFLCMNGICPPFIRNALVYRDQVHFTNSFAEMLGDEIEDYFKVS